MAPAETLATNCPRFVICVSALGHDHPLRPALCSLVYDFCAFLEHRKVHNDPLPLPRSPSTFVQFGFLRPPNKAIIQSTLPMGVFQVGGHIFSSMAISRIPVSTVHTIKALSPLFTVAAYALLFGVSYSPKTYISLLPLTFGVMLACSFDMSASNAMGLLCAFGSAIVFVSQNIFFKKIVPSGPGAVSSHKLDKLNLLFYSSSTAFLLMIPIWMYYDLPALLSASVDPTHVTHPTHGHATPHSVTYYFIANGTVHFAQNIIAFVILASTSPVTYSIRISDQAGRRHLHRHRLVRATRTPDPSCGYRHDVLRPVYVQFRQGRRGERRTQDAQSRGRARPGSPGHQGRA
ncbi:hypothetical protein NUW54_g14330 [Trametes sanguinea]|uniref:Uncharacterized protein n=1 Tax=Trametes sanguinea TaxID=158606 RepID=A0ACC1MCW9_9APHY|nr:hypothetical protein NUW54_g14330 [Trametes sanguinea]